jgi:hypothetical protein
LVTKYNVESTLQGFHEPHLCLVNYLGYHMRYYTCKHGRNKCHFASFPSVYLHSSTHLRFEIYLWNFILVFTWKYFGKSRIFLNIWQEYGVLYIKNQELFIFSDECYRKKFHLVKGCNSFVMLGEVGKMYLVYARLSHPTQFVHFVLKLSDLKS